MSIKKMIDDKIDSVVDPAYASRHLLENVPKYAIPKKSMLPRTAYDLVHDELMLDGNARLNLATFVTTWMEAEARTLMSETCDKNIIDKDEYPQTAELEQRCIRMLAKLWHAPNPMDTIGTSTTGSSEACMLAGLAFKWRWRQARQKAGLSTDKPNLVAGINVQVCWKKFCLYWDIEFREAPMEKDSYALTAEKIKPLCDENTIGVIGILGSTFTGEYEPIKAIHDELEKINKKNKWDIPMHIDGASGGLVAPFIQSDLLWDFQLPLVKSINVSGHKYGLVYPGVGWVVWRKKADLPEELIFNVNYLGGQMPTFSINFSRPGNQVIAQYYNFIRLGLEGYARIHSASQAVAKHIASALKKMKIFDIIHGGDDLPVICWKIKPDLKLSYDVFSLSDRLRMHGWQVPAYTMPSNLEDISVMRIVVREGMSMELANMLIDNLQEALDHFEQIGKSNEHEAAFNHS